MSTDNWLLRLVQCNNYVTRQCVACLKFNWIPFAIDNNFFLISDASFLSWNPQRRERVQDHNLGPPRVGDGVWKWTSECACEEKIVGESLVVIYVTTANGFMQHIWVFDFGNHLYCDTSFVTTYELLFMQTFKWNVVNEHSSILLFWRFSFTCFLKYDRICEIYNSFIDAIDFLCALLNDSL